MATRSLIARRTAKGNITTAIYCHWDGHPETRLEILLDSYNTADKVKALMDLGNLSSLGNKLNPTGKHTFDNPEKDVTIAYHRDRGDTLDWAVKNTRINERKLVDIAHGFWCDYVYIFNEKDSTWSWIGIS